MPSLEDNLSTWDGTYDWTQAGDEWSAPWGGSEAQWFGSILPRIHSFVPTGTILEIAPGYGRWTQYLKDNCERLILVDLSEKCIEACKKRFLGCDRIAYHVNDGKSLEMIPHESIDFVFSFDSLVHAEAEVLQAYVSQLANKLRANGVGFIHHSNLGMYSDLIARTKQTSPDARRLLIKKGELIDIDTAWHAQSMTAKLFEEYCDDAGMECISQELIDWFNKFLVGCFSTFTPKGSSRARPNRVMQNFQFMDEIKMINSLSPLYSTSPFYECFHDGADHERVWGWAWDKHHPDCMVTVDVYDGDELIASGIEASEYRADLTPYTKDRGFHAFDYKLPEGMSDGRTHRITVKISGTGINAYGSPQVVAVPNPNKAE